MSAELTQALEREALSEASPRNAPKDSDIELANRFASQQAASLRYVAALGKWFVWDGCRWENDDTLTARDRATLICKQAAAECNDPRQAKHIASAKAVAAVERLAQADRLIAATVDQWDSDPYLLNTPGGTVDLKTGTCRPHNPRDYLTKITGTAPDPLCPIEVWLSFLKRVTDGKADLADYLQRMAGLSLTGSTQEHAMFFLYGLGANGKSTFLNALMNSAGDYHKAAPIETFTAANHERHPTDLAALRGARLVTSVETEEGRRWAESRIKALTGGDPISARFMRQDFFEYTPQFKLVIAGNHKPGLRSVDEAIRRRFNLIPFTVTIPPEERDELLPEKLKAELPGILNWMIEGCTDWLERGLSPPEAVTKATAEYLEAEDAIAAWIEECAERDPSHWDTTANLFASWNAWADKSGEYVGSIKRFTQNLEARGFTYERKRNGRGFRGINLNGAETYAEVGTRFRSAGRAG